MTGKRLESLDALRGFDLLCLLAVSKLMDALSDAIDKPWTDNIMECFTHKTWEGFSSWDLVMPLFMFMAGVAIPYSLARYRTHSPITANECAIASSRDASGRAALYWRLARRVALLWLFGMMVQGNLMSLDPSRIYLFSNTLQAIAVGYLFSAVLFLHTGWKTQLGIAVGLLLAFWAFMEFITFGSYGGGDYSPHGNLCEGIDMAVLGRFRDTAEVVDGQVVVKEWYTYTWILSSMNFIVTVLSGVLAGEVLRSTMQRGRKTLLLLVAGIAMVALGWTWNAWHPVIKHIWTSSMVLVSSGYCFLLMGLFYYWIDCRGHNRHLTLLKVYGMNSITAYVVSHVVSFSSISRSLFHGLEQYVGDYYGFVIQFSNVSILFLILYLMYRNRIFLRV